MMSIIATISRPGFVISTRTNKWIFGVGHQFQYQCRCHQFSTTRRKNLTSGPVPLEYKTYPSPSNGAPLYVLHGLFGSKSNWNSLAKRLAQKRPVITTDSRNHGLSPTCDEITYDLMSQDLLMLIEKLGHKKINLMGHSMGGRTCIQLALTNPDLIDKLMIVDVSPSPSPIAQNTEVINALLKLELNHSDSIHEARKRADKQLKEKFNDPGLRHFLLTNIVKENDKLRLKVDPKIIENNLENIMSWTPENGKKFSGPTLFIGGARSPYISKDTEPSIKNFFPTAEIKHIAGAGHWVHAEEPQLFLKAVEEFLVET